MQNKFIPRSEVHKLLSSMLNDVSLRTLGQWIKVNTDNEYIVINRMFVKNLMDGVATTWDTNLNETIENKWSFDEMKEWL
jgi:hypothetical protein